MGRPNKLPWLDSGWDESVARKVFIGSDGNPETGETYHCTVCVWVWPGWRLVVPIPRFIHHCLDMYVEDRFGAMWTYYGADLVRHSDAKTVDVRAWRRDYARRWWWPYQVGVGVSDPELVPVRRDRPRWVDLFGVDPDYLEGQDINEWLDEQRGEA